MATDTTDTLADLEEVVRPMTEGKKPDPELAQRIKERADKARQEVFKRNGVLDIGVPAIRSLRDE